MDQWIRTEPRQHTTLSAGDFHHRHQDRGKAVAADNIWHSGRGGVGRVPSTARPLYRRWRSDQSMEEITAVAQRYSKPLTLFP